MNNIDKYLNMQKSFYNNESNSWDIHNPDPVVGSYHEHNAWTDYDVYLFKDFETLNLKALEYGCGPGRNIIRFSSRFKEIDGTDISEGCIEKAKNNLELNNIKNSEVFVCDGQSIPSSDENYDVVFSVICLQHIASHSIRMNIMKDIYRVLKPEGFFCFQVGFGEKSLPTSNYYADDFDASSTNGAYDFELRDEDFIKNDLEKIGFKNYKSDIRPTGPGDFHSNWIWVQVQK
jgi:ubiquinone/menaquinone biosynthesis C-methylase UbiE